MDGLYGYLGCLDVIDEPDLRLGKEYCDGKQYRQLFTPFDESCFVLRWEALGSTEHRFRVLCPLVLRIDSWRIMKKLSTNYSQKLERHVGLSSSPRKLYDQAIKASRNVSRSYICWPMTRHLRHNTVKTGSLPLMLP
jgi:hypothetical protein